MINDYDRASKKEIEKGIKAKVKKVHFSKDITTKNYAGEFAKALLEGFRKSSITPYRTGNLKYNGITAYSSGTKAYIYIGGRPAPYATYLEYGKMTSGGNVNRHKGWVEKALNQDALPYAISMMNGKDIKVKRAKR